MVNFSLNPGSLMGIILAFAGVGLYLLRSFRPNLARDYDVFFAAVALLCGGIFFFQSWRLDPLLQFGVFLLTGSSLFFAYDSIRLRGIATEQAKRSTPIVDEERPVSRVYRYDAPLEPPPEYGYDYFQQDRQPPARRIRGSEDSISPDYRSGYSDSGYEGGYDRERPGAGRSRRPSSRRSGADAYPGEGYEDPGYPEQGRPENSRTENRGEGRGEGRNNRRRPRKKSPESSYPDPYSESSAGYDAPSQGDSNYPSSEYDSGYRSSGYASSGYDNPETPDDRYNTYDSGYRASGSPAYDPSETDRPSPRRSRRRPPSNRPPEEGAPYVDYRPLQPNQPDMETDNSNHFDD